MKLPENVVYMLPDYQFLIATDINLDGLQHNQISVKGVLFEIDTDSLKVTERGEFEVVLDTEVNIIVGKED